MKFFVNIPMPGIKTIIVGYFKMFLGYMLDQEFDKINHRASKVAADVFSNDTGGAGVWFRIDIKTIFVFIIDVSFDFFDGRPDVIFHFVEQSGLENVSKVIVIEMFYRMPKPVIGIAALRN